MRRRLLVLPLVVVALAGAACSGGDQPRNATRGQGPGSPGPLLPSSPTALPDFTLAQFQQLLGELRGMPVLVNVWGSWCPPCRAEAPDLAKVSEAYRGRVQFLGVDILDQREPARDFIREFGWRYPSVFDPEGEIRDGLGYVGQPVTVVYDESGDSVFVWSGAVSEDILVEELDRVVGS
jgi:thiol-disulfide isomerase/thioredoxin